MEIAHKHFNGTVSIARWTIQNFFGHVNKKENLDSNNFEIDGLGSKFFLRVCLYDEAFNFFGPDSNRLHYYLHIEDMAGEKSINVDFKFWMENEKGEKCAETPVKTKTFNSKEDCVGFYNVLDHNQLNSKTAFFGDGPAVVCCEITREFAVNEQEQSNVENGLRQNLWKAYQSGLLGDVIIQVEGKDFKISKTVLCANSVVFERMFLTSSCKEAQTGTVQLNDTKAVAVESLIEFMHRGEVANLQMIVMDLFKLSHKYDIKPLNTLCVETVGNSISSENLFEVVVMAYEYDCEELKKAISEFLSANLGKSYFTTLMQTREWHNFTIANFELASEIFKDICAKMGTNY